jgi:hypothetical protein
MARPFKEIDPERVKKLATMGLTVEEIAAVLECNKKTLERRFVASIKEGRMRLNASLKRKQFTVAMKGSVPMLIWLGKQHLGQADKHEHDLRHLSDEEVVARAKGGDGGGDQAGASGRD